MICNCSANLKISGHLFLGDNNDIFSYKYFCNYCRVYFFTCAYCKRLANKWKYSQGLFYCSDCNIDFRVAENHNKFLSATFNYKNVRACYNFTDGSTFLIIDEKILKLKNNIFQNKSKYDIYDYIKNLLIYL